MKIFKKKQKVQDEDHFWMIAIQWYDTKNVCNYTTYANNAINALRLVQGELSDKFKELNVDYGIVNVMKLK